MVLELEHLCCLPGHEKCHPVPLLESPTLGSHPQISLKSSPTPGSPLTLGFPTLDSPILGSSTFIVSRGMCLLSSGCTRSWWGKGQRLPSPEELEPPRWRAEMGVAVLVNHCCHFRSPSLLQPPQQPLSQRLTFLCSSISVLQHRERKSCDKPQ